MATPAGWSLDVAEVFIGTITNTIGRGLSNGELLTAVQAFDIAMNRNMPVGWRGGMVPAPPLAWIFTEAVKEFYSMMHE